MKSLAQQYDESCSIQGISLSSQTSNLVSAFNASENAALMLEQSKSVIAISVLNKYALAGLKQGGLGYVRPIGKSSAVGITVQINGTQYLKQTSVVFSYSKKLNDKFGAGITFILLNSFEQTIGSRNNILGKVGIAYRPSKLILIGATIYNPTAVKLSSFTGERIPTYFSSGIRYKVSSQVYTYAEYRLGLTDLRNFKIGLSYEIKSGVLLNVGFQNTNSPISFGLSCKIKNIAFRFALQYHQVLGFSPAVGGDIDFN